MQWSEPHDLGAKEPKRFVVVSYLPLLQPDLVGLYNPAEFARLSRAVVACPDGRADACLWMAGDQGVAPVLVLPQADAIADHLLAWAEGCPEDWFTCCVAERAGRYVVALVPHLVASVERFRTARQSGPDLPVNAAGCDLIFRPLAFVSGPRHTFGQVRRRIANPSLVGLLDAADFSPESPSSLNPARIRKIGPVQVCWDCRPFGLDVRFVIEQLVEAAEQP